MVAAPPADPVAARVRLSRELEAVQLRVGEAQKGLQGAMESLADEQRKLEYKDEEIARLYAEIKELEKQLVSRREALEARKALRPGVKEIEARRRGFFKELESLRAQEAAIRRELSLLDRAVE